MNRDQRKKDDESAFIVLDGRPESDFSDAAVEEYRRRTRAGEDPIAVVKDINAERWKRPLLG